MFNSIIIWDSGECKFIKKIKLGVVFYKKSKINNRIEYKKPEYDRRITSMRVYTHIKK